MSESPNFEGLNNVVSSPRVLAVDDDQDTREVLREQLARAGFSVTLCESAERALALTPNADFDVVLSDLHLGGMGGIELCERLAEAHPDVPVVVVTAHGSVQTVIDALRAGAFDFVQKPIEAVPLCHALRRATERRSLEREVKRLREQSEGSSGLGDLIGESTAMKRVYSMIRQVADTDASVLISGESGTGKELVARALHQESSRRSGPFMAINCAAVPAHLLESELFGHMRGAFTGANSDRRGLFEQANGGTVLLDEIGELPQELQPKLLRVLQTLCVRPVGGSKEINLDIRVLAATNRQLEAEVEAGRFRADLFYRLNVVQLELPPLRDRGTDVLRIAESYQRRCAEKLGRDIKGFDRTVARKLLDYDWPGNVRELANCIERAVTLATHDQLRVSDLPERVQRFKKSRVGPPLASVADPECVPTLREFQEEYIQNVLSSVDGNKTKAARLLGLDRRTLYRKLERKNRMTDSELS